ncbi:hypothetical protein [Actinoallomurus vinaceus]
MRDPDSADTNATEGPARATPTELLNHLQALRVALLEQGFDVGISYPVLTARNSAVTGESEAGRLLCPGLSQKVVVEYRDGQPWFSWVWPPPRKGHRDEAPGATEHEPLCPASDITEATARVAKVIRLRKATPDDGLRSVAS